MFFGISISILQNASKYNNVNDFIVIVTSFLLTGLKSEGLYRVSGFTEHIEDVKMSFDRGELSVNIREGKTPVQRYI